MVLFTDKNIRTHLHTTPSLDCAKSICSIGFFVAGHLCRTTDDVSFDTFDFWYRYRRKYGDYVIIIQIPIKIILSDSYKSFNFDEDLINGLNTLLDVEEDDEEIDYDFLIKPKYIRGYFIRETNDFVHNPDFNPY